MNKKEKKRTLRQSRALWLYFEHLAQELNSAGLDLRKTLREDIDVPWNKNSIHDYLWVPVQKAQLGTDSTTALTTKDIDKIFDTINRHLGERFNLHVPFPNIDALIFGSEQHPHSKISQSKLR